jgi:hypothetical protein
MKADLAQDRPLCRGIRRRPCGQEAYRLEVGQ